MTIFPILLHLILTCWIGGIALSFFPKNRTCAENLVSSLLLGMYLETFAVGMMVLLGVPLIMAFVATIFIALLLTLLSYLTGKLTIPNLNILKKISTLSLRWYEWLLLISLGEKLIFSVFLFFQTPLFFWDALRHWAGRGRALYAGVNWSVQPDSSVFLGSLGHKSYPLMTPLWKAITAILNGGWNDTIARADSFIYFLALMAIIWLSVWRFSQSRGLAAAAVFILAALPLQVWHSMAGQNDIYVEVYFVAALAAILRHDYLLAGMLTAGAGWAKNEGFFLCMPALFLSIFFMHFSWSEIVQFHIWNKEKWKGKGCFLLGSASIAPWLIYKEMFSLHLEDIRSFSWHPDAPQLFWEKVVLGPTHSIFWVFVFAIIILTLKTMIKIPTGRALLAAFFTSIFILMVTFFGSSAYIFLKEEQTIQRIMLQCSGIALITAVYGVWLKLKAQRSSTTTCS